MVFGATILSWRRMKSEAAARVIAWIHSVNTDSVKSFVERVM